MRVVARFTDDVVPFSGLRATLGAMFIKVTQTGNRRYAQLVESFRNVEGKPRQRARWGLTTWHSLGDAQNQSSMYWLVCV